MRYFLFIVVNFITIQSFAEDLLVQVPDQCLYKKEAPCLIRALDDTTAEVPSHFKIYFAKDVLLKITQFSSTPVKAKTEQFKVELLKGKVVIINSVNVPFYLNTVSVGSNETYYIKKNDALKSVELYKSDEAAFFNITRNDDVDMVEIKDFASRRSATEFLDQFSNVPGSVYKQSLAQYEIRLNDQVQNQKLTLQRKIATAETARKLDAEARQKQKNENKKMKHMFFMRTFEQ